MFSNDFNNDFLKPVRKMTKEQLIALINAKITGQGNQIDLGGALADILLDLASAAAPIEVTDITKLTNDQLDSLNVGDKVVKVTGTDKHLYLVTYKATTGGGLCLSYADAVNTETVSYDRTESGWAFNSIDKGTIPPAE